MLLSVFTPTNRPKYLKDCLKSLEVQNYKQWEWIIAPNDKAIGNIPGRIARHRKVRVIPYHGPPLVGSLKRFCCDHAKGDVFIELDHDDMLVPGVLKRVVECVREGAGFVFSNAAVFFEKGKTIIPTGYSENYGWETYPFRVYGREFLASRAFPVTARSLCEVYYAPDHVRCWTREAYEKAGGHDPELEVGDDHDLICRTYLAKVPFKHTGTCGYLYRNHPGNTVKSHNRQIQSQQNKNRDRYIYPLIDEWVRRNKLHYLDLTPDSQYITWSPERCPSIQVGNGVVGAIRAYDMLQFIPQEHVGHFIEECWRILVPGGWLCVAAPSTDGRAAFLPPFLSYWNEQSFDFWTRGELSQTMGIEQLARFQKVRCFTHISTDRLVPGQPYVYADLCALKGQRQPGRVLI